MRNLVMMRAKGLHGPLPQKIGNMLVKPTGNYFGVNMPGSAAFASWPLIKDLLGIDTNNEDIDYARTGSNATFVDFEGVIRQLSANDVPPFVSARRVKNIYDSAIPSDTPGFSGSTVLIIGNEYMFSLGADSPDGSKITINTGFVGGSVVITANGINKVSLDDGIPLVASQVGTLLSFAGNPVDLLVEDVTGQSDNQNCSEYVSNQVAGEYFAYRNGNSTDASGIVTEAQGAAIDTAILKGLPVEKAGTNFADTDEAGTQVIDMTGEATGVYTVSMEGTGSFAITDAGTCVISSVSGVTEASSGGFTLDTAGTGLTLTLTGSVDADPQGNTIIQVEAGLYATSFIPASGGGVTRAIADAKWDFIAANGKTSDFALFLEIDWKAKLYSGIDLAIHHKKFVSYFDSSGKEMYLYYRSDSGVDEALWFVWGAGAGVIDLKLSSFQSYSQTDHKLKIYIRQTVADGMTFRYSIDGALKTAGNETSAAAKTAQPNLIAGDFFHLGSNLGTSQHCDTPIKDLRVLTHEDHLIDDYLDGLLA